MVLPVSNTAAPSPANCSWLMRRTERSARRVNSSRPRGPSLAARRVAPFTGGMGEVIASSSGPLTARKPASNSRHASPSPGA